MNDSLPQGFTRHSGVVLRREVSSEGNVSLYLLLKGTGPLWVSAPGAGKGRIRFGGGTEPLTWGVFNLYKGARKFYLKSVDVREDFWSLRSSAEGLRTLLEWDRLLCRHLAPGLACDDLVPIFYWCSALIRDGADRGAAEWRFLRRWLEAWGLAPSLDRCLSCGIALEDAFWSAEGLQCSKCAGSSRGALLDDSRRRRMIAAAECSLEAFRRDFPPSPEERRFWRDGNERMKALFESVK
ncbi:MAG: DNA repair protein RecO [Synergistaceae bacterium]|nr:DNA repair protein RecO [Synergistaceae bacterium]